MKVRASEFLGILAACFGLFTVEAAPTSTAPVVPPPGGTLAPGPVGGQMAPAPVGGKLTPGNVLSPAPLSGTPPTGIPGGTLYVGTNGIVGNPALMPGGTLNSNGVGGAYVPAAGIPAQLGAATAGLTNPAVIVAGPSNSMTPPGGAITPGTGGTVPQGVIIAGPSNTVSPPGGAVSPGTGGTVHQGVIVTGGNGQ